MEDTLWIFVDFLLHIAVIGGLGILLMGSAFDYFIIAAVLSAGEYVLEHIVFGR